MTAQHFTETQMSSDGIHIPPGGRHSTRRNRPQAYRATLNSVARIAEVGHTGRVGRTVTALVTWDDAYLGAIGPFPVSMPWWSEVEPVVAHLREVLDVPVFVLRLLLVEGGEGGRDGHVTYHVAALSRPAPGLLAERPIDDAVLAGTEELRSPWARLEGIRDALNWASDTLGSARRRVTGPPAQRKTWNLAALFRLPTGEGPVWLKTTPRFAADEGSVIAAFAGVDPALVPPVIGAAQRRVLLEHLPGEDCWDAAPQIITSAVQRLAAAQAVLAGQPASLPPGLADRRTPVIAGQVTALLDGPAGGELSAAEVAAAHDLLTLFPLLADCGLPDTIVHGDFHPGNWRSDGGPPVIVDWADAHFGNPVLDGLRTCGFLPEGKRPAAARAWINAWASSVPGSAPARALRIAEPLAHLTYAVRYQEFLDGIEPSERIYHAGDPAASIRAALRIAQDPRYASCDA
jgi:Ser/Thr protein kinase RdoA (MazF antagonist)